MTKREKSFDSRELTAKPLPFDPHQWLWPDVAGEVTIVCVCVSATHLCASHLVLIHLVQFGMNLQKQEEKQQCSKTELTVVFPYLGP